MNPEKNLLSVSASPITGIIKKPYYDLQSTIKVMNLLSLEKAVDGFEVQNLAEWCRENPPRDDVTNERRAAWDRSPKYSPDEVERLLQGSPILSVHANRDTGILLCSDDEKDIIRGKTLLHESLWLAEKMGARVCVFHLWDTWKPDFDILLLKTIFYEAASYYPRVKASVENVPTHMKGFTPLDLVRDFEWITLDLRWAALYDEFHKFESLKDKIVNIHLRGKLENGRWVMNKAPFEFYEALATLKTWGYQKLLTLEPEGGIQDGAWEDLVTALYSLRA
ncbi:MAG: hypothetical protein HXS44_13995 [Theionarchaea archaeon]|nr:hypothetical protein [Theionarchaea archaeon]